MRPDRVDLERLAALEGIQIDAKRLYDSRCAEIMDSLIFTGNIETARIDVRLSGGVLFEILVVEDRDMFWRRMERRTSILFDSVEVMDRAERRTTTGD